MTNANDTIIPVNKDDLATWGTGLTKREYYTGLAMQGFCANTEWAKTLTGDDWDKYADRLATASVQISDAIIKALNKE